MDHPLGGQGLQTSEEARQEVALEGEEDPRLGTQVEAEAEAQDEEVRDEEAQEEEARDEEDSGDHPAVAAAGSTGLGVLEEAAGEVEAVAAEEAAAAVEAVGAHREVGVAVVEGRVWLHSDGTWDAMRRRT